jgi:hypothetical protein
MGDSEKLSNKIDDRIKHSQLSHVLHMVLVTGWGGTWAPP